MKNHSSRIEPLEARIAPAFGAVFELSSLDGLNGFRINGVTDGDSSGSSVSDAGDVNGDGFDDLLIGADRAAPNGYNSGASYVVFGKGGGFSTALDLSALNGANGFKISGAAANDFSGFSVSTAGDVNDDGFDDLLIGAYRADPNGLDSGASYVVFGKGGAFSPTLNLSTLNGANGFKINGVAGGDFSGRSVSGAGDVNGDGFADLLIGAPLADPNGVYSGASYVVFGKGGAFSPTLNLSTLNGVNGFKISGVAAGDGSGRSVSTAGDVNGDGFDDLLIGAYEADPNGSNSGASYVVFGKGAAFSPTLNLSTLNGANGFKISGAAAEDASGFSVSTAGDVNGDGFDDLLIGAYGADPNGYGSGASYVVFGKAGGFAPTLNLSTLNGVNGFAINGVAVLDSLGRSISGAGDVNGDGFDDLIVGALGADPNGVNNSGASYVVFGKAGGFAPTLNPSTLNGVNGFKINGVADSDYSGISVSGAGDVNGDGFDDVLIGALRADPNGSSSGASYVVFGSSTATLAISDATVAEGDAGTTNLAFTVSLSAASTVPISVRYSTQSGTAQAGSDFTAIESELLTFAPGETNKMITVRALSDTLHELDETFTVVLSEATNATIVDGIGTGTILNDDGAPLISIGHESLLEGDAGMSTLTFTVSLSSASGLPATVNFASADSTALAGSDYTALTPGTLNFAPGETTKTISVEVLGDTSIEDHESFSVTLSGASGATIGSGTATGTILNDDNDDTALGIAGPADGLEGDSGTTPFVFTVSLEKASALPVTVNYATTDGTAKAGSDFTAPPAGAQLSFAPGETTKTIVVEVAGDTSVEEHESFLVLLSSATNATIADGTATGTILNDDALLRISAVSAREGDSGTTPFVFTISLEKASALPVTVSYATADGTANAGSDYEAAPATQLTFAPGETTKSVAIGVTGDTEVEAHETFSVILSAATGAGIAEGAATGTILNDETLVRITDASLLEGHAGTRAMTFTVSLTAATALPVSVNFTSADGTATSGTDYTALTPGRLDFAPGETSKTLTVDVLGDTAVEASETFSIVLSDATNAVIDDGAGLGTILDDDVTLAGPRKATFTDVDGDLVKIKVSRGTLKVEDFTIVPSGLGAQLALVDFRNEAQFAGANLNITAKRAAGAAAGVRSVDVGYINASGIDLGKVVVKGDLGQIDAGNDADQKPGVLSLSANSLGHRGLDTQLPGGSLSSDIVGALKTLKLADGMQDAALSVSGDIGRITITGDVLGSAIRSDGKIGASKISGDLAASATSATTISARGTLAPASDAKALAIATLSIGGSVDHAQILAGYDRTGTAANADASIGAVSVGGAWIASNLVAGITAGPDSLFGTDDDAPISRATSIISKIASILIKGTATGTEGGADHFGFVAEQIGAFSSGGARLALTPGPSNDLAGVLVGLTGDLRVREAA